MATGRRLSYLNPRLMRTVFLQLQQQQQEGLFCDVTLQGDGDGLHVHSCVIAACSPYLATLLQSSAEHSNVIVDSEGSVLRNRRIINVSGIPRRYLLPLVHYMYTSALEVAPADAFGVLKTAQKLRIPVLENLKLEGGRIVRPETGRKLNRDCLGSRTQTYHVVNDLQHSGIGRISDDDNAHEDIKPFLLDSENNGSHSPNLLENISSCQNLAETIPSKPNLLNKLGKEEPHIKVRLKRCSNSLEESPMQNSLGTVSKQINSSPEGQKQEMPDTPGNGSQKRKKLNREAKVGISLGSAMSMSQSEKLKDNMIVVSKTEKTQGMKMEKTEKHANLSSIAMVKDDSNYSELSNAQCDVSSVDEDSKIEMQSTKSLDHLTIQNEEESGEPEESLAFFGKDNKKDADEENLDIADPTVSYSSTCSSLDGLRKSDLTEIQKNSVAGKDLMPAGFSNSEAGTTYLQGSTADESGNIQTCPNMPSFHEVEKVKLRKIKNGSSWEIVKDMYPDMVSSSENAEHINELEELLEQMLNMPSPTSDVDVGGCSPVVWTAESVWPDLSSDSDEEIDVLH
ncbi:BTB/POZ domain-containing protein 18 [Mantella aurantiaca]